MKFSIAALSVLTLFAGWMLLPAHSDAGENVAAPVVAVSASATSFLDEEHEYQGSKSCKMCHLAVFKSWEETLHAKAMEALMPGNRAEVKEKFGLDPQKDYTKDEKCIKCHTTGFGKPGGYVMPTEGDAKSAKDAEKMAGVGCEMCHGPGGGAKDFKKELLKSKAGYKWEQLAALGMVQPDESTCTKCHNAESPTLEEGAEFKYEDMKAKEGAIHAHEELKQREG
jgi:hypothetical protein